MLLSLRDAEAQIAGKALHIEFLAMPLQILRQLLPHLIHHTGQMNRKLRSEAKTTHSDILLRKPE
jgi:hypothetical protein